MAARRSAIYARRWETKFTRRRRSRPATSSSSTTPSGSRRASRSRRSRRCARRSPTTRSSSLDLVKEYRDAATLRRGGRAAARAREGRAVARARGVLADQRDQARGAQGRRGDRVAAEGAREEPERSDRRTSAWPRATLRCSGSTKRSPRTRRRCSSIRATRKAQFALAQLYVQGGKPMKAAELLRNVLRTATDEEVVGRARARGDRSRGDDRHARRAREGRVAAVVHDGAQAGLPARARRSVPALRAAARRARAARHRGGPQGRACRARRGSAVTVCSRCSRRCATRRTRSQQRVAVAVLGHLGNKGAAAPLVRMARQEPPKDAAPASAR